MSVDVFGRTLNKAEGTRGPPGIGFKLTKEGQFDIENKRLCNIAAPNELNEAVNLETLQRIIRIEIDKVTSITSQLSSEIKELDILVDIHRDELDDKIRALSIQLDTLRGINQSKNISI